jgi:hypothetical protein
VPQVQTTKAVKVALLFLRLYLILLVALVVYRFLTQIRLTQSSPLIN